MALGALVTSLLLPSGLLAETVSKKAPAVPQWSRFEREFHSSASYTNPLQEAALTVEFISPLGQTQLVSGFWDGGRTWKVRFTPDQVGPWRYQTTCSDGANRGLNHQTGRFLCTSVVGPNPFHQHGPVRVVADRRHFEYADGKPFFWLADTVLDGALLTSANEWDLYARVRASQGFTAAQWAAAPGADDRGETPLAGSPDCVQVNPAVFKRLDAKLERLRNGGLLSVIAPLAPELWDVFPLDDSQAELVVRYMVARWGAEPVAWLLPAYGKNADKCAACWKQIGPRLFRAGRRAPVVLLAERGAAILNEAQEWTWVDVIGLAPGSSAVGASAPEPTRPVVWFLPGENAPRPASTERFSADDVRRPAYGGLLAAPPAGVSYAAEGLAHWDRMLAAKSDAASGPRLPLWQRALFMPGAKQMGRLADFMTSVNFWRLRPQPTVLSAQPGDSAPRRWVAATETEAKDLAFIYIPEDRTIEVNMGALPASPSVSWFNPRTGETNAAVAVVLGNICQFPTPDPGDWVLVIKSAK